MVTRTQLTRPVSSSPSRCLGTIRAATSAGRSDSGVISGMPVERDVARERGRRPSAERASEVPFEFRLPTSRPYAAFDC